MTQGENLYKIRIANSSNSFQKHEVVKLLLVMKILNSHRKKFYTKIYTEHRLNGHSCDIYFEDLKSKAVYIYEIQKAYSPAWLKKKTEYYNSYEVPFFNSVNFIPINLNKLSNNISKLNEELEEFVF